MNILLEGFLYWTWLKTWFKICLFHGVVDYSSSVELVTGIFPIKNVLGQKTEKICPTYSTDVNWAMK